MMIIMIITNETKRFPMCKQQNMHSHFRSSSLTFSLIPWSNFNVAQGINTGSCHTKITMRNAESFPAQSICTDEDDDDDYNHYHEHHPRHHHLHHHHDHGHDYHHDHR